VLCANNMKIAEDWLLDMPYNRTKWPAWVDEIKADALRHAAELCAKVSPKCGELKDNAIRDCIRVIQAEADKLTKP